MGKIRNLSRKASMGRNRVKKHRRWTKLSQAHQKAVQNEIEKRQYIDNEGSNLYTSEEDHDFHHDGSKKIPTHDEEMINFKEKIKLWSVKHCITKRALNDLLSILIVFGFNFLPKDSRTLMKTPVNVNIVELSKGKIWYNGIKNSLQLILNKIIINSCSYTDTILYDTIHLDFNFDGVELFNSSKKCFWPIIASIRGMHTVHYNDCIQSAYNFLL